MISLRRWGAGKGGEGMICAKCGTPLETRTQLCPVCTPRGYELTPGSGSLSVTGYPVGTVVESPPDSPEGRRVDYRPASGGTSLSETDSEGSFRAALSGALERGTPAQKRVMEILIQLLRASGNEVRSLPGARDDRGEDGLLQLNGRQLTVQIVTTPTDPGLWEELTAGDASRAGTQGEAVRLLRQTLEHKGLTAKGTLLAIDAGGFGALVGPRLVEAYLAAHGDPAAEFSFNQVWIVGPTARSSVRLGNPRA